MALATKILVTRTQPGADRFAGKLTELGFEPVVSPLLAIEHTPIATTGRPNAIIITSQHAVSALTSVEKAPLFCVGEETATTAADKGFRHIFHAPDAHDLVEIIRSNTDAGARLLYLRGRDVTLDFPSLIPDREWMEEICYAAHAKRLPDTVITDLASGKIGFVTLMSVRTAEIFQTQVPTFMGDIVCMSEAIGRACDDIDPAHLHIAHEPTEAAMLTTCAHLVR